MISITVFTFKISVGYLGQKMGHQLGVKDFQLEWKRDKLNGS